MSQPEKSRRELTPEAMEYLERLVQSDPTFENAFRLMNDASYLFEGERYPSVVALTVLCMEEIGKYLLTLWSKDPAFTFDKRQAHKAKQMAIGALFVSDRVRAEYIKK